MECAINPGGDNLTKGIVAQLGQHTIAIDRRRHLALRIVPMKRRKPTLVEGLDFVASQVVPVSHHHETIVVGVFVANHSYKLI